MLLPHDLDHHVVDLGGGVGGADQGGVPAHVLVGDGLQGHHIELVAHAVPGDHGPGQLGSLLDVVGRAGGNGVEDDLFGGTAAGKGGDLVQDLLLAHQVPLLLLHLHGVPQSAGSPGDDGDLGHRGGVGLEGGDQGVADLVVGHDLPLLVGEDLVLFLVAGDDHLDALLKVGLVDVLPALADSPEGSLVDHVGQLRAGGAGGGPGDGVQVHVVPQLHLLGVDLQDVLTALQVRQLHGHPPVEPAGPQQGGVQGLRPVGRGQDHHTLGGLEAVHLGEELVQGLLPLVVPAHAGAVPLLANGVDLVDEHDAGGLLVGLAEQVADLVGAHTHEHLHELRPGDGKEGDVGLAGHGLGQQRLAGARRAHQQHALGHLRADGLVLLGIVEEVHNLHQVLLCLLLASHVGELDACLTGDVDLGAALAELHGIAHGSGTHLIHQIPAHELTDDNKDNNRENKGQQKAEDGIHLLGFDLSELTPGVIEPVYQIWVVEGVGAVERGLVRLVGEVDHVLLHLGHRYLLVLQHGQEGAVVHGDDLLLEHPGEEKGVEQDQDNQRNDIVKYQRFFGLFHLFHKRFLLPMFFVQS